MLKKFIASIAIFFACANAQAALIEFKGYSRDSANTYVTGNGLDWMMWHMTGGLSVNSALTTHQGWRLATNSEMATLFNVFQFGKTNWTEQDDLSQRAYMDPVPDAPHIPFLRLFGSTVYWGEWHPNIITSGQVIYGSDAKGSQLYNSGVVGLARSDTGDLDWYHAQLNSRYYPADYSNGWLGVALVRNHQPVSSVSAPASFGLIGVMFSGCILLRRRLRLK